MSKKELMTTNYGLISGIYFRKILKEIIKIGRLESRDLKILDYGAGYGYLKQMLMKHNSHVKITNYDIKKELSEIDDWRDVDFDIIICNQVFYTFDRLELVNLLSDIKDLNKGIEMLVGISRQGLLNDIGKIILGEIDAHSNTKLEPREEINILLEKMDLIAKSSIWGLADVYHLKFKI